MEPTRQELSLDESVAQVMQTLPPVIRKYLAQGKYTLIAKNLMAKYRLRIDQAGILEREIMLLLMGIENPDEFTQALAEEAKLDEQTIGGIVQDVNEQIFIPLRSEMQSGGKTEQPKSAAPAAPRAPILPPRTTVIPANPQMPTRPPETFVSVPKYAPPPKYFKLQNKIPPPVQPPPKPLDSSRLLEDHEEPHIELHSMPPPGPRTAPPPPNLPGAMPPPPRPTPPPPTPPAPRPPAPRPQTPPPPAERYSTDPYREPIE